MSSKKNIVRVSNVTKTFQLGKISVHALKGVTLEIPTGQYISIMGPSGSGKSTLFNMIGGLDKPSTGKVFIDAAVPQDRLYLPDLQYHPGHDRAGKRHAAHDLCRYAQ